MSFWTMGSSISLMKLSMRLGIVGSKKGLHSGRPLSSLTLKFKS